jgi:ribonucleoside-triphosphate reductase
MRCDKGCAVFARIVGYYQPTQQWNEGKREEFLDRAVFDKAIKDVIDGEKLVEE